MIQATGASLSALGVFQPKTAGTANAPRMAPAPTVDVRISELAQNLKGRAAEIFQYLDQGSRNLLEGKIGEGKLSVADVQSGLDALGLKYAFIKYVGSLPKTQTDRAAATASTQAEANFDTALTNYKNATDPITQRRNELQNQLQNGAIDEQTYQAESKNLLEQFRATGGLRDELHAAGQARGEAMLQAANASLKERIDAFRDQDPHVATRATGLNFSTEEEAALDRLRQAGFDAPQYSSALQRYADDYVRNGAGEGGPAGDVVATGRGGTEQTDITRPPAGTASPAATATAPGNEELMQALRAVYRTPASPEPELGGQAAAIATLLRQAMAGGANPAADRYGKAP